MGLFKKKCAYCKSKIEKGKETFRHVKDPVLVGTKEKTFCSEEHADSYETESKNAKKCGGSCCG